ncbi:hypothetical protein EcB171_3178 [Escherichia coli B171]|uniref:Uncharacterized protein n=1 Tax=Escherichia coli TaxID=562 RepID=A0A2X1MTU8_ECOLX|nr:hypothetical protein EcB171_3178 [Escherichia coli B171]EHX27037.1 hypothetical protein ECDEC12B_2785 [Escherichia coli DEC12B]EHX39750.1 hypothetical protein ECDEC12C_5682 [Escherichia coli DEC12C]SPW62086.1 Uncharacterised protein [Escherichia coli]
MILSPIENCRISFLPPRKDGLLKKQHPKELTDSHLNTNLACQMAGQI